MSKDTSLGVNLIGRDLSASRTLRDVGNVADRTARRFSVAGGLMATAFVGAGLAAGAFAVKLGVDGVKAAIDDEASVSKLSQTMKNLGLANEEAGVSKVIDDMQFQVGVADDELRPAMDRLLRATGSVSESQRLLGLTLDISANKGIAASAAANALGKAAEGNFGALGKLGVGLDKATIKTGDYDKIITQLAANFQGSAARAADTWEGRLKRLDVASGELKESFGTGILDGFIEAVGGADGGTDDLVDTLRDARPVAQAFGKSIGSAAAEVVVIGKAVGTFIGWLDSLSYTLPITGARLSALTGPITLVTSAWQELLAVKGDIDKPALTKDELAGLPEGFFGSTDKGRLNKAKAEAEAANKAMVDALGFDPTDFTGPKTGVGKAGGGSAKKAADEISAHWQSVLTGAAGQLAAFTDSDAAGFGKVGLNTVSRLIDGIKVKGSEKTTAAVKEMLGKAFDALKGRVEEAEAFGKSISDGIMSGLDIGDAASGWQDRQDAVKDALASLTDAQKALNAESTDAEKARVAELQAIYQTAQEDAAKGGATIVDSYIQSANRAGEFATKLHKLMSENVKLNDTTWLQIAGLNAEQGIKVIDAFYDAGIETSINRANDAVGAVDSVSKQVGAKAISTFKAAGIETAIVFFEALVKSMSAGPLRKSFNDALGGMRSELTSVLNPVSGFTPYVSQDMGTGGGVDWSTPDNAALLEQSRWAYENIPSFADGGYIPATPGGRIIRTSEQGKGEIVGTLEDVATAFSGSGSGDINVNVNIYGTVTSERDLATTLTNHIAQNLRRRGEDTAFLGV